MVHSEFEAFEAVALILGLYFLWRPGKSGVLLRKHLRQEVAALQMAFEQTRTTARSAMAQGRRRHCERQAEHIRPQKS